MRNVMASTQLWYSNYFYIFVYMRNRENMESGKHYYIDESKGSQSPRRKDGSIESKFFPDITGVASTVKARGGM